MPQKQRQSSRSTYPINIDKGTTYSREFTWLPGGKTLPLTGKVIRVHFKDVFPAKLELSSDGSPSALGSFVQITNSAAGKFIVQLSSAETAAAKGNGKYWIEAIDGVIVKNIWPPDTVNVREV